MVATLIGIWLAMWAAGTTPTGRWMRRMLVEAPAAWLAKWTRLQAFLFASALVIVTLAILLLDAEGLVIFGLMSPEAAVWTMALEASGYLDAWIAVTITASTLRAGAMRAWMTATLTRLRRPAARRAARARHTQRVRRPSAPANDDADGGPIRIAA